MRWGGGDGEVGLTKGLENALEVGPNPGRRGGSARVGDLGEALLVAVPAGAVGGGAVAVAVARVAPGRGGGGGLAGRRRSARVGARAAVPAGSAVALQYSDFRKEPSLGPAATGRLRSVAAND